MKSPFVEAFKDFSASKCPESSPPFDPDFKSYLVIVRDEGAGFKGPIIPYSDLSTAWAHFIDMLSKYPGDVSSFKLYCVGEFYPLRDDPFVLYREKIEVTSSVASSATLFDHFIFDVVQKHMTNNPNSIFTIGHKDPFDDGSVLADELRSKMKEAIKDGAQ